MAKNTLGRQRFRDTGKFMVLKYQNRKLYSSVLSRYIALEELLDFYQEYGDDLIVKSVASDEDLTQISLISAAVKKAEASPKFRGTLFESIQTALGGVNA